MSGKSVIPEIDIGALVDEKSSEQDRARVRAEIHTACKDIGFLSVVNHGVPMSLIERMEKSGKQFFYLPKESKMVMAPQKWNSENSNVYRGYFPSSVFGKEGLDMADPMRTTQTDPDCHLTEINKFPADVTAEQKQVFEEYFAALHNLGVTLMKTVFQIFKADDAMVDGYLKRPDNLITFRLNYYPQNEEGYQASEVSLQDGALLACETHTDSVLFTVLYQDLAGGLQVQSPTTKAWHDVPCNREAFVVNTGKALEALTNGHYKATYHRVLLGTKERMSIPFFLEPVREAVLDPQILVPEEEARYKARTYEEHVLYTNSLFKEYQR